MLNKTLALVGLLVSSVSLNAAILTQGLYTHDTTTDIVSDGTMEWLQWDVTVGMSVDSALVQYESDGWRLAGSDEMTALLSNFASGSGHLFDNTEDTSYTAQFDHVAPEDLFYNQFINMFGITYTNATDYFAEDPYTYTMAYYGTDANGDEHYQRALVLDDHTLKFGENGRSTGAAMILSDDIYSVTDAYSRAGVALVRGGAVLETPLPAAVWLFGSALLGLGFAKRKKTQ